MERKKYKLIGLQIEGLRLIKAAYLKFKPNGLTEVVGKNDQGKSTVIDAIEILFKGFKQKTDDIITHGMDKAVIVGELEDFTVKRVMTDKSDRLEVVTKDNFKPTSPQNFLNAIINNLTFRPQVFLDKKPEDKLRSVMDILKIDFTEENRQIALKENDRLLAGRELKSLGEKTEPPKVDAVDTAELIKQKKEIEDHNATEKRKDDDIYFFQNLLRNTESAITLIIDEVTASGKKQSVRKSGLIKVKKAISDVITDLPKPDYKTADDIDKQISNASTTNQQAQAYTDYLNWQTNKTNKQTEYDNLTTAIADLKDKKLDKLRKTKMPVKGLAIKEVTEGNYGLFYNDIYSENWSQSLGWKIALGICAAMQPDLRAIFLDCGESLDSDSRKALDEWAIANDIQVIITVVQKIPDNLSEGTFYIEAGRIFNNEGDCMPKEPAKDEAPEEIEPPKINPKEKFNTQELF
jgi:hypothetical protein